MASLGLEAPLGHAKHIQDPLVLASARERRRGVALDILDATCKVGRALASSAERRVCSQVECRAVAEEIGGQVLHDLLVPAIVHRVEVRQVVRARGPANSRAYLLRNLNQGLVL